MKYVSGVVALCMVIGLAACAKGPVISLEKNELATSATSLKVLVANPVKGTDQSQKRYWVCLAKAGTPDSEWGDWSFVYDNMTAIDVAIKKNLVDGKLPAGDYEVRLHSEYPTKPHNVVMRIKVAVK
ncbi:MAG TPA: hypothetical protein PLE73_12415 [Spirochaetota bacterium]|nr:hypothetical protein [Spirochaetota bacterium]HOS40538.1 hypothetical protein [Spirochaetota bacterium]HPI23997.1 hypothetical protein [Spirochaetota bacterium]HPU88441.1 hypothetical protein [Spirochaetota bacterium]